MYSKPVLVQAVPYFLWDNREPGELAVWMPERAAEAQLAGEAPRVKQEGVLIRASHCNRHDKLEALTDGRRGRRSSDQALARMTFSDHRGTEEWLRYDFDLPRTLSKSAIYWFDDAGRGGCRPPESWRLSYFDGEQWKDVSLRSGSSYGKELNRFNEVEFLPVKTSSLRVDLKLAPEYSAGLLEWRVEE